MSPARAQSPVKIVATLGPASSDPESLRDMIRAGMNVARLNFSHGTREEHRQRVEALRKVAREEKVIVAILQDLCGPKIRIGKMEEGTSLRAGDEFSLVCGIDMGNSEIAYVDDAVLFSELEVGDHLLLADGMVELVVESLEEQRAECKILGGSQLSSGKGINVPRGLLRRDVLSIDDLKDLAFGAEIGVDWVGVSFVRTAKDLRYVRGQLAKLGKQTPVIAKIETAMALTHMGEILDETDGVLLARGDLALETPFEQVPIVQKEIIIEAHRRGKPVITATQMMVSMVKAFRPTRAEVNDVANAVLDGTDAIMLSEETAVGDHPALVIEVMSKIAANAARSVKTQLRGEEGLEAELVEMGVAAKAACQIARELNARGILTWTEGGLAVRLLARANPGIPIIAPTLDLDTARKLCLLRGVVPLFAPKFEVDPSTILKYLDAGKDEEGSLVIFGHERGEDGRRLSWIRIARLSDASTWVPNRGFRNS